MLLEIRDLTKVGAFLLLTAWAAGSLAISWAVMTRRG
jgi:hypothetical protein